MQFVVFCIFILKYNFSRYNIIMENYKQQGVTKYIISILYILYIIATNNQTKLFIAIKQTLIFIWSYQVSSITI